jgi:hypothetical protein
MDIYNDIRVGDMLLISGYKSMFVTAVYKTDDDGSCSVESISFSSNNFSNELYIRINDTLHLDKSDDEYVDKIQKINLDEYGILRTVFSTPGDHILIYQSHQELFW